jgi:hypothetical protein
MSGVYTVYDGMYDRLPSADQRLLEADKVLLFLKAVDVKDRHELGSPLADETQPNGLGADCAAVKRACNRLDKHREWLEDADAEAAQPQSWKKKVPTPSKLNKPTNDFDKKAMEESIIEELSRKFGTVSLANMNRWTQKRKETYRCI